MGRCDDNDVTSESIIRFSDRFGSGLSKIRGKGTLERLEEAAMKMCCFHLVYDKTSRKIDDSMLRQ